MWKVRGENEKNQPDELLKDLTFDQAWELKPVIRFRISPGKVMNMQVVRWAQAKLISLLRMRNMSRNPRAKSVISRRML